VTQFEKFSYYFILYTELQSKGVSILLILNFPPSFLLFCLRENFLRFAQEVIQVGHKNSYIFAPITGGTAIVSKYYSLY
jgi:hypothetical protein